MKYLCIALVRFYQKFLSPLKRNPSCRFYPTCSAYAIEAFQKRGFFAGLVLTVYRVLRCNPFCAGGLDPVPEKGFGHHQIQPDPGEFSEDEASDERIGDKGFLKYHRNRK